MSDLRPAPDLPPFIAWMSRHGLWLLAAIIVIELGFHAFAVFRTREAERVAPIATPSRTP
jgi:hypothetical protein